MKRIVRLLDIFAATVSGLAMVGMIAVGFTDSIGRQFGRPLLPAQEMVQLMLLIFFFASIIILVRENAHIRVGLVVETYGPRLAKVQFYVAALIEIFCTAGIVYMIWDFAGRTARIGRLTSHYEMPLAPYIYAAAALSVIATVLVIDRYLENWPDERDEASKAAHKLKGTGE